VKPPADRELDDSFPRGWGCWFWSFSHEVALKSLQHPFHVGHLACDEGAGDFAFLGEGGLQVVEHVLMPLSFHVVCLHKSGKCVKMVSEASWVHGGAFIQSRATQVERLDWKGNKRRMPLRETLAFLSTKSGKLGKAIRGIFWPHPDL